MHALSLALSSFRAALRFLPVWLLKYLYVVSFWVYGERNYVSDDQMTVILVSMLIASLYAALLLAGYLTRALLCALVALHSLTGVWGGEAEWMEEFNAMGWLPDSLTHVLGVYGCIALLLALVAWSVLEIIGDRILCVFAPELSPPSQRLSRSPSVGWTPRAWHIQKKVVFDKDH
eukprot:TRINITY_DN6200_c0_g1_i1.p1 TRINITY_DN6200_c0_g1~~TRINITY_DN6200_c0_g1_i1.p1  ORF type:complete len:202 (-),score=76.89 TRINITY_DN6200_c0_g1_i1:391-915(-)